jgi:dTDP-D-glucose 4,6-dehydratase
MANDWLLDQGQDDEADDEDASCVLEEREGEDLRYALTPLGLATLALL